MTDALDRIAAALERLSPPRPQSADPRAHAAYLWDGDGLTALTRIAARPFDALIGIDAQKSVFVANLERLSDGHAAQDVLLWGARGTGKSALVASAIAHVQASGGTIGLIEVAGDRLDTLPRLFDTIAATERPFAVFIDDLGFDAPGDARALRSLLEGGAQARPANARLIVTANRRHLVPREFADDPHAVNPRDAQDDALALADRFGLSLGFHAIDQDHYLSIVRGYAEAHGLSFDRAEAINWATRRGSRSGRIAWHYVVDLAGRAGKSIG
jgi:uncharacterized protein